MKILIYKKEEDLKPIGGPSGYLFNLNSGLKKIKNTEISFLKGTQKKENKVKQMIKKNSFLRPFVKKIMDKKWNRNIYNFYIKNATADVNIDFNAYDIIHFHSTSDMYDVRENLKKYKNKVVLTSHSPKPLHLELQDNLKENHVRNICKYRGLSKIDTYAFSRADYIIFPCQEAEEPYYHQWDLYKEIHHINKHKYRYLLTGLKEVRAKVSKEDVLEKYNIPKNAFLISYVGRHNEVKGYDVLKQIGKEILNKQQDIYFIIAGKEGPIYRLKHKKWIEIGWTNDPHSLINASDLFILPNKETYFDLIFLEVLSLGVPLLVSDTGGNKYFKKFKDAGIFYFHTVKEAVDEIQKIKNISDLDKYKERNKKIFQEYFIDEVFAKNYIELMHKIGGKNNE